MRFTLLALCFAALAMSVTALPWIYVDWSIKAYPDRAAFCPKWESTCAKTAKSLKLKVIDNACSGGTAPGQPKNVARVLCSVKGHKSLIPQVAKKLHAHIRGP